MPAADPFDSPGFGAATDVGISATLGILSAMPAYRSIDGKGVAKQVADLATRDAIPDETQPRNGATQVRQEGMTCYVAANQRVYRLIGGILNANWVDVTSSTSLASKTRVTDEANVLVGHILTQSPATAQRVRLSDNAADDALSRPVGIATTAQPLTANPVAVQTSQGEVESVRMVAGLALGGSLGQEVILSSVNGDGTIPGGASAPVAGQLVQRVGILLDQLTYDGGADRLVLVQIDFGGVRRIEV